MADQDIANVFAIPDFWRGPRWLDLPRPENAEFFGLDIKSTDKSCLPQISHDTIASSKSDEFFRIPAALEPLKLTASQVHLDAPAPAASQQRWKDVNLFDDAFIRGAEVPMSTAEYKSWDGFVMPDLPPIDPLFITEAGPGAYDAALELTNDPLAIKSGSHNVVQTHPYLTALLALAMGRASIFFTWNERTASFVQDLGKLRISGYSANVLDGLQTRCLQCGNISRFLYVFVQITYKTHPSAGRVALAKSMDTVLLAVQTKLGGQARKINSPLQLQSLVYPVSTILTYFNILVTKLNKTRNDEQLLSLLFAETQMLDHGDELLSDTMREVLARVSEPWLDFTQKWIGVKAEEGNPITKDGPGKSFVKVEDVAYVDDFGIENDEPDYVLDKRRIPTFMPDEVAQTMFETGKTLRLLQTHHADHPLCNFGIVQSSDPPSLDWHYNWKSIQVLQERAIRYETNLLEAIRQGSNQNDAVSQQQGRSHSGYDLHLFGQEQSQLAARLVASIKQLNGPLPAVSEADRLSQLLHDRLFEDENSNKMPAGLDLAPHWTLLPLLSFAPLIESQARLINREYMKLLFTSHDLRDHILLQKDFQLLGNGVFCDLLSHALFDADLETTERQAGVARNGGVMGLRLGSRETWPPASSELRLALMGVLTESYLPTSGESSWSEEHTDLPGDLSFAVRDLSDEEIEKCMNPGSLEALDFLRLSYKPPPPLAPIITPVVLVKYDKIFKHLLRILRMLYVAGELHRNLNGRTSKWQDANDVAFRFRFEAQHFVSSITAYVFDTGIALPWAQFLNWLDRVRSDLEDNHSAGKRISVASPDNVRMHHEKALDSIMNTLFLRKRQQPILKVLEDIFTCVLKFSKLARLEATGSFLSNSQETSMTGLYRVFKNKVGIFITVCRGLSEKTGQHAESAKNDTTNDGKNRAMEENTIERLLLQLEMSGHYGGTGHQHI